MRVTLESPKGDLQTVAVMVSSLVMYSGAAAGRGLTLRKNCCNTVAEDADQTHGPDIMPRIERTLYMPHRPRSLKVVDMLGNVRPRQ